VRRLRRETPAAAGAALIAAGALGHDRGFAQGTEWVGPHLGDLEPVDRDLKAIYAELPACESTGGSS
jgi:hypothetical protein